MPSSNTIFNQGRTPAAPTNLARRWVPNRPGAPQTLPRFFRYPPMKAKWRDRRMQWPWKEPPREPSVSPSDSAMTAPARQKRDKSPKLASKRRQPTRRSARIQHEQEEKETRSKKERTDAEAAAAGSVALQRQRKGPPSSGISKARAKKACVERSSSDTKAAVNSLRRGEFGNLLGPEDDDYMQYQKKLTLQAKTDWIDANDMVYDDETDLDEE